MSGPLPPCGPRDPSAEPAPQACGPARIPMYVVDAFADRVFAGNPAAVCLLDQWLPDPILQAIAAENNLSETAFIVREASRHALRWFTPEVEVDLCGHATLAAAHVLQAHEGFKGEVLRFETRSGTLPVSRQGDWIRLDFPSRPAEPCASTPDLETGLGRIPIRVARSRDYLAVFETEEEVRALTPDFAALSRVDALGIIATAPGKTCDFVSRFFAPRAGIPEDPVTGSAHCTLIPYWSAQLGRDDLLARQVSRRGGELRCEARGERVGILGRAVTYSIASIRIA